SAFRAAICQPPIDRGRLGWSTRPDPIPHSGGRRCLFEHGARRVGSLILPTAGAVYVDANAVIYAVERIEPYSALLAPLWLAAQAGHLQIITSEMTWLEALTRPFLDQNTALEALFRAFLTAAEVRLIPATLALWEQ